MKKSFYFLFLSCFLTACLQPDKPLKNTHKYFDVQSYFTGEAERLSRNNNTITKTVSKNGEQEQRSLIIKNWKSEFELFELSDINKPAWRDSYSIINNGDDIIYRTSDPKLRTKEIHIVFSPGKHVKSIAILNESKNLLYNSIEKLVYIPDSTYQIDKEQDVVIIGNNHYKIIGKFKSDIQ